MDKDNPTIAESSNQQPEFVPNPNKNDANSNNTQTESNSSLWIVFICLGSLCALIIISIALIYIIRQ